MQIRSCVSKSRIQWNIIRNCSGAIAKYAYEQILTNTPDQEDSQDQKFHEFKPCQTRTVLVTVTSNIPTNGWQTSDMIRVVHGFQDFF